MKVLSLGYSPCPNDTFIFYALVHGLVSLPDVRIAERLDDVETLNSLALKGDLDLTKISYHALGHLRQDYALLRSGGALGRGCGPLVVSNRQASMEELKGKRIAIPGKLTTASLLLQLYDRGFENRIILPFHEIMGAVARGDVDAGVIIHESRFTFAAHGLVQVLDLGAWWEAETGLPIPLGGILARRSLGAELIGRIEAALRRSVEYAFSFPEEPRSYIRRHAQELEDDVVERHIGLYVNDFSLDLGLEGIQAVETLLTRAQQHGIIPTSSLPLFAT